MKKIIGGILGIFLVIGIVAGVGYALFSSTVSVQGAKISTAGTGLKIDAFGNFDANPGKEWRYGGLGDYTIDLGGNSIIGVSLYPNHYSWGHVKLINTSAEEMPLNISAKIGKVIMDQDWYDLKDVLMMKVCTVDGLEDTTPTCGGEHSIHDWYYTGYNIIGNPLLTRGTQDYWVMVSLPRDAAQSTAGKTISGIEFVITGTQAQ